MTKQNPTDENVLAGASPIDFNEKTINFSLQKGKKYNTFFP